VRSPGANELAPVAIFAYRRPHHTRQLIESLRTNDSYANSPLFVFCDGARGEADRDAVAQTRAIVRELVGSRGEILEYETNRGLARSILAGVTELCSRYGQVIVLEDDLVLHSGCLDFLNASLRHYVDDDRVCHVNAYRYPLPPVSAPYFSRLTSSWGWATWQRAWAHFEPDAAKLQSRIRSARLASALDFGGAFPYFRMLQNQAMGQIDSWAIRWYASNLLRGAVAICPNVSQVNCRGFDNTGVHCGVTSQYEVDIGNASLDWPIEISEDIFNYRQMQIFLRSTRRTFPQRVVSKLRQLLSAD
jgi:hypothetical protein